MKNLKLLMVMTILSCSAFSQGLTPTVQLIGNDTAFCFDIPQAREIAKRIANSQFKDSINTQMEIEIFNLSLLVENKKLTIEKLKEKLINSEQMVQNNQKSTKLLNQTIEAQQQELKSKKFQLKVMGLTIGAGAILAIITN